jgi:exodeoxyribonuclease V alpha subunit
MKTEPVFATSDIAEIDRHFADFISGFGGNVDLITKTASLLSRSIRHGHICLKLGDPMPEQPPAGRLELPDPTKWGLELLKSRAFGLPDSNTPLVVASGRLYLRRYWDYEQSFAKAVLRKAQRNRARTKRAETQEAAVGAAMQNYLTIISGGPGTGKTTTVLKILQRLLQQKNGPRLRVALAAPTGKAAARLQELLRNVQQDDKLSLELKAQMPRHASTIHRLLGSKPDSVFFRHDARNPLPLDLLVVDEASMVALPLMAKLFDALLEDTRVILLGDRDQLASVEPGAVLADIAETASIPGNPLGNALVTLSKNYRFGNENAIYQLSSAVRVGNSDEALKILNDSSFQELGSAAVPPPAQVAVRLEETVVERYKPYLREKEPAKALAALQQFRVLCALREGPFGVKQINRLIEAALHKHGLIADPSRSYGGMPILITQNDYQTRLFNGDVGILLPDPTDTSGSGPGQLWAWFIGEDNNLRRLSPGRLPDQELAYAMTVHKAQGSEFEQVLLVLPDRDSAVLSRELVYTGITRASKRIDLWFSEELLRMAIDRKAVRASGLRDALHAAR